MYNRTKQFSIKKQNILVQDIEQNKSYNLNKDNIIYYKIENLID